MAFVDSSPLLTDTEKFHENYLDDDLFNVPIPGDSSMMGAFQILINTAIGSGTLMIPYCYKMGIGSALVMSAIIGCISLSSFWMMIDAGYFTRSYDYRGLFTKLFNEKWIWTIDIIIFLVQIGSCMIYSHWNGLLINRTLGIKVKVLNSNEFWVIATTMLLAFPMTIPRSIAKLESIASVGTLMIILLIAHALYWLIKDIHNYGFDPNHEIKAFHWDFYVFIPALGVNSMSYNCIINLFPTLEHLRNCTVKRGRTLALIIVVACFILYGMFGVITYLDKFDSLTPGSALEQYDPHDPFTIVATIGVVIILLVAFPLCIWAARISVDATFWKGKEMTTFRWITIGFVLSLISALLSITTDKILVFFNIVGGLLIPVVTLFVPSLFYLRACPNRRWYRTVLAFIVMGFTVVAAVACTWQTALEIMGK